LCVRSPDFKSSEAADRALTAHYGREECIEIHDGRGAGVWLAVRVLEGCELDGVVSDITRQLADVAAVRAKTNHPEASTALPDEVGLADLDSSIA
jgi:hypothetical protein